MSDNPEALPELPEPDFTSYQTDSVMRQTELRSYSASQMRAYARAALAQQAATPIDPLDDDVLTVAYMAGRYDGRKAATPAPAGSATSDAEMMLRRIVRRHRSGRPLVLDDEWPAVEQIATRNASPLRAAATPAPAEPRPSFLVTDLMSAVSKWVKTCVDEAVAAGDTLAPAGPKSSAACDEMMAAESALRDYLAAPPATPAAQPADERGAFEARFTDALAHWDGQRYLSTIYARAWEAWQARAALKGNA